MMFLSIISMAAGTIPSAITALTVCAAASTESKAKSRVCTAGGFGVSLTAIAVVIPSIPSEPTYAPRRSSPGAHSSRSPKTTASPDMSTTSTARTWALVTPRAKQWGPPALVPTLPPKEHTCWLEGSGAKCRPWGARARLRSRLIMPGCTQATR